jgi:hypothetical protein
MSLSETDSFARASTYLFSNSTVRDPRVSLLFPFGQAAGSSDWCSPLSEITAGGSVGDFSLIGRGDQTHQTTCVALEDDTEVFFLSRAVFAQFVQRHPLEFTAFVRTAVARLWRVASYTLQDFLHLPDASRDQHVRPSIHRFAHVVSKHFCGVLQCFDAFHWYFTIVIVALHRSKDHRALHRLVVRFD